MNAMKISTANGEHLTSIEYGTNEKSSLSYHVLNLGHSVDEGLLKVI